MVFSLIECVIGGRDNMSSSKLHDSVDTCKSKTGNGGNIRLDHFYGQR
jgi:hypothetical protein